MTKKIDINCDMGESFGDKMVGNDAAIMPYISSANIACGFHGGDDKTINRTMDLAIAHDVKIGAHPSYPDLENFGRKEMDIPPSELKKMISFQIFKLYELAKSKGSKLHHVKPHGALYNKASRDEASAKAVINVILSVDKKLMLYAPAHSIMYNLATEAGLKTKREMFADRTYNADLSLTSRKIKGSVLTNEKQIWEQVRMMVMENKVKTLEGQIVNIVGETLCVHGDNPNSVKIVQYLYKTMTRLGMEIG